MVRTLSPDFGAVSGVRPSGESRLKCRSFRHSVLCPRAPTTSRLWTRAAYWLQDGCSTVSSPADGGIGAKRSRRGVGVERLAAPGRAVGGVEELGPGSGVAARTGVVGAGRARPGCGLGMRDGVGRAGR